MSARPQQPEPFVRGCIHAASGAVAYPRLPPADAEQVPGDVWSAATLPALVRLEMVGDASAVRIRYRTTTANLGYRGDGAGCTFVVFRSGRKITEEPAELGESEVTLALAGDPEQPAVIYLPEGMRPVVTQVQPVDGGIRPAPRQARCLVIGDAVTQGWLASAPASSWPAILGRKIGLDVCNLGFAGTTRLEAAVGQAVAATPAEVVVVSVGTGCWSRPPHSAALLAEELRSFLELVRSGHPDVPLVVVSPILRPAAEDVPNVFGATLADLRRAVEDVVVELGATDDALALVPGEPVLTPEELGDGVYPNDEGHKRLAAAVNKVLSPRAHELRHAALSRWQEEVMAATPAFAGQLVPKVPPAAPRRAAGRPLAPEGGSPEPEGGSSAASASDPGRSGTGPGSGDDGGGGAGAEAVVAAPVGRTAGSPRGAAVGVPPGTAGRPAPPAVADAPAAGAGPEDGTPAVPEAVAAAARASAAAARAYAVTTGRAVAAGTSPG